MLRSGWLPRAPGWILLVGGPGYVLSTFVGYLAPSAGIVADLLVVPATAGELWILGYLIIFEVRSQAITEAPQATPVDPAAAPSPS
ncbi:protein of unknown function [Micromonospora phaseoli]|uniref:DUF4386 domain-containing protein n=1 Tax=Micromonospora phaseoli TaxID=1144548 RepID=A0A1H7B7Z0_9ACTN|nr:DUF4386 domain-containing protein [Micromonospora phaseoli]PZV96150.1 uncharacterized protein DUF4386 [Micromonospora phaseoli]GIJ79424.1 hypothetical protein Xph01_38560 [Micromonospora phaseoli]SEJ69515.1 protein of unknown function [Micromonospora phaseoli]